MKPRMRLVNGVWRIWDDLIETSNAIAEDAYSAWRFRRKWYDYYIAHQSTTPIYHCQTTGRP